ncbi:Leukocyte receptor cluster member 1 [Trichoplax sp. H2]|nr:Leukocyte receptor cluster member 1 [Trichoplax sp. H2]|eukprot:RDD46989.1 Leukocyte receptor cluster member 1 [Trichoplax sp. H2]
MNILPKKSWHVRNKRNIERVRRDEEKARQEEEEKQRKIELAEKESRLEILRKRSRIHSGEDVSDSLTRSRTKEKNINLFEQDDAVTTNSEYEAEKKAEQERLEKKLGILTYLGQSAIESHNGKPWYCDDTRSKTPEEKASQRDKKRKNVMDPLNDINKYLKAKKTGNDKADPLPPPISASKAASSKGNQGKKTLEELRAERIRRERGERQREQDLLKRIYSTNDNSGQKDRATTPYQRYNSQFHPEYARQSRQQ